jgi:hypothetical protein
MHPFAKQDDSAEDRFRLAFERLKNGETKILKRGASVSQNNVAKEADCVPSALRKSRFPELIKEIQSYIDAERSDLPNSQRKEMIKKRNKNRTIRQAKAASDIQRDELASQLLCANAMIIQVTQELADTKIRLEEQQLSAVQFPFPNRKSSNPKATPYDVGKK